MPPPAQGVDWGDLAGRSDLNSIQLLAGGKSVRTKWCLSVIRSNIYTRKHKRCKLAHLWGNTALWCILWLTLFIISNSGFKLPSFCHFKISQKKLSNSVREQNTLYLAHLAGLLRQTKVHFSLSDSRNIISCVLFGFFTKYEACDES